MGWNAFTTFMGSEKAVMMATSFHPDGFNSVEEALDMTVEAVERGDLRNGEAALNWVLNEDPKNTTAWIWLACCAPDDSSRQICYRRASEHNLY